MDSPNLTRPAMTEAFFTSLRQMACIVGYSGQIVAINAAFTAALGWTETELRGVAYYDIVLSTERQSMTRLGALIVRHAGSEPRTYRRSFRHKDGSYRLVEWTAWADPHTSLVFATGRVLVPADSR